MSDTAKAVRHLMYPVAAPQRRSRQSRGRLFLPRKNRHREAKFPTQAEKFRQLLASRTRKRRRRDARDSRRIRRFS